MQGHVTLPVDMQSHGLGPREYGLAVAVNGLLIVLVSLPISHAAGRWPRFGAMAAASLLLGLGFGFQALADSLPLYALAVAIWTLGEIASAAVAPAIIADLAPIEWRGLYQGVYGSSFGLAFFVGPVLGGWILQRLGAASALARLPRAGRGAGGGLPRAGAVRAPAGSSRVSRRHRRLTEFPASPCQLAAGRFTWGTTPANKDRGLPWTSCCSRGSSSP